MNRGPSASQIRLRTVHVRPVKLERTKPQSPSDVRTLLPPHSTDLATFITKFLGGIQRAFVIATDNLKFCGVSVEGREEDLDAARFDTAFNSGANVIAALDHHNPVPDAAKGKVGAELVLHYKDNLIDAITQARKNGYELVVASHNAPFDPDAMIGQWLIKEIVKGNIGKGEVAPIYTALAKYANITDFYTFPFTSDKAHLTLKGVCEGLAKLHGNKPKVLAEKSDMILNWVKENNLDPNDFYASNAALTGLMQGQYKPGSVEQLIKHCITEKKSAMIRAQEIFDNSNTYDIALVDTAGDPINTKVVLLNSPDAKHYTKEFDDIAYSREGTPVVMVKPDMDNRWWVTMRPSNYSLPATVTEKGKQTNVIVKRSDPGLKGESMLAWAPWVGGFHSQILAKLPGEAGKNWEIWPYNGTAEKGVFGQFKGQQIINGLLG